MTDLAALSRKPDLVRRIGITLAALAIYRAGGWIPLPGVDTLQLHQSAGSGLSGAAAAVTSIMALGVTPLLTALLLAEAAMSLSPDLRRWGSTPPGRTHLGRGVVIGALLLAALQAYGIAAALEAMPGIVMHPGTEFRAGVITSLVGATGLVVWLAHWITRSGIGHGFWVLLAAAHINSFIDPILRQLPLLAQGAVTAGEFWMNVALWIGSLALAVAVLVALVKATPRLSEPEELIWSPLLGFMVVSWLLGGIALLEWLLLPAGVSDLPSLMATYALTPLLVLAIAAVVLLRRRSLAAPDRPLDVAAAAPVIVAIAGLVAITREVPGLVGGSIHLPEPASLLILAAVGLMVLETLRPPQPAAAAPLPS
ncbi:MAG: hypothetical protein IT537_08250 [Hyphomicrobiales bacterium]|nr:hypothetical protein [Hyphomicrobiales bacterium]